MRKEANGSKHWETHSSLLNPFQPSDVFHIEISYYFFSAKQMTCFYMKRKTR